MTSDDRTGDRATTVTIAGAASLLALHKTLLEAKFHPEPHNFDIAGSPLVADIARRTYDALIAVEDAAGRHDKAEEWRAWRHLESKPWIATRVVAYASADPQWSMRTEAERLDYLRCATSPFEAAESELVELLAKVDAKSP